MTDIPELSSSCSKQRGWPSSVGNIPTTHHCLMKPFSPPKTLLPDPWKPEGDLHATQEQCLTTAARVIVLVLSIMCKLLCVSPS